MKKLALLLSLVISCIPAMAQFSSTFQMGVPGVIKGDTGAVGPGYNVNDAWTTVNGSLGNYKWQMPFQGNYKRVVIQPNGYTSLGPSTITFPTAFTQTPYVSSNSALLTPTTLSTTGVTFPLSVSAISGNVVIEGP